MVKQLTNRQAKEEPWTAVRKLYGRYALYLVGQWFWTFWVLGMAAGSLSQADGLPSAVPMLGFTVSCAAIHVVITYYFLRNNKPVSRTDPRPHRVYMTAYAVSCLTWFAALACTALVLVETRQFDGAEDREKGLQSCGRFGGYSCYHATTNAKLNTLAKISAAGNGFIILLICAHWFEISKLWWRTFTAEEIRDAYDQNRFTEPIIETSEENSRDGK